MCVTTEKRLGRVELRISYVVDMDNETMVDHAFEAICDDVGNMVKVNEVGAAINVVKDNSLSDSDIPSWLLEDGQDDLDVYTEDGQEVQA